MGDKAKVPSKPIHCYQCTKKVRLANSLVEVDFCLSFIAVADVVILQFQSGKKLFREIIRKRK